ncbi:hypothetical protein F0562_010996 [Nyssa sinensis]|uniref:Uncharacterized protein n=1 Tax=Nyssa sinensis TaxID=561372 RepID=A0A5J5A0L9_9ASTE|nr:hypothetical protein F0562_010996 [Nyssa sinensis]
MPASIRMEYHKQSYKATCTEITGSQDSSRPYPSKFDVNSFIFRSCFYKLNPSLPGRNSDQGRMAEPDSELEDSILIGLKEDLEQLPPSSNSASIYRVPKELLQGNKEHFIPTTISIGPFHADERNLRHAQQLKLKYLKFFLTQLQPGITLKDLIQIIRGVEEKARLCYDGNTDIDTYHFVRMMVLDGCFILGLILQLSNVSLEINDPSTARRELLSGPLLYDILKDLLLLENQLPFFVLDVRFNGGVLQLPRLVFQESTIPLFWNLLALDQCLDENHHFFTSYAIFMDNLIDDEKDVDLLIDNGVIDPWINDKKALVSLFNNLAVGVVAEIDLFENLYCAAQSILRLWLAPIRCLHGP